jgi:hypothetical protein
VDTSATYQTAVVDALADACAHRDVNSSSSADALLTREGG